MKVEQKIYTESAQVAIVESSEERVGEIIFSFCDEDNKYIQRKLFLTSIEAIELSTMLKSMVDKVKTNSL
jgi:hypothetical protein